MACKNCRAVGMCHCLSSPIAPKMKLSLNQPTHLPLVLCHPTQHLNCSTATFRNETCCGSLAEEVLGIRRPNSRAWSSHYPVNLIIFFLRKLDCKKAGEKVYCWAQRYPFTGMIILPAVNDQDVRPQHRSNNLRQKHGLFSFKAETLVKLANLFFHVRNNRRRFGWIRLEG